MNITAALKKSLGKFAGNGVNHEGQPFTGEFELLPLLNNRGFKISFLAKGNDGTVYHQEESVLAPSLQEKWTLWNLNTNIPGLVPHELTHTEETPEFSRYIFGFGSIDNRSSFRETVTLTLWNDNQVSYLYSWGMPGGDFAERSGVKMSLGK